MATAEAAQASLGPRYAPDDPTLPKPWKGLIDGSTGTMYYWNPETNITQYEKPVSSLAPPLPPGQPPSVMPTTQTLQSNGISQQQLGQQQVSTDPNQQNQLMTHQQQGLQMSLGAQQQTAQMAHRGQQQGPQYNTEGMQQPEQLRQQMLEQPGQRMQQTGQQTPQHQSQQMQHQHGQQFQSQQTQQMYYQQPGQQIPQPQGQHITYQQSQQYPPQQGQHYPSQQGQQYPSQQGQQYPPQQTPQFQPQQSPQFTPQQNQQFTSLQNQQLHSQQSHQFPSQQSQHMGFPPRDETEFQPAKPSGFSAPQMQQTGTSHHNLPTGPQSAQAPKMGSQAMQQQQFGSSSANAPQTGIDSINWQQMGGSLVHSHMGPAKMPNQQPGGSSIGSRMGYGEAPHGRDGNGYFNVEKEGSMGVPQQPKLAAIPIVRNQQDMRISHNVPGHAGHAGGPNIVAGHTGGLNSAPGHALPHMYNHPGAGPPFPNSAPMRQPPRTPATSDVTNLSAAEVYRRQNEVTATGDNVPAPFMTFEATGFPPEILREIQLAGFASPTPIQAQTWPIAMQSRDIVAIAKTGSGKTLGYLMPAFVHLRRCRNGAQNGPTVLVLAPTRELATQIQDEVIKFGRSSRVSCTCLYGGAPKALQLKELDRGADIVVATPGRLNDILEMKKIDFHQVSLLVLDEADRMLDMGFEPQIRKIVNEIPPRRQTLMYTATWPKEVRKIAGDLLVNPVQVNIGKVDELAANKSITQYVEVVPQMNKQRRLEQILRSQERGSRVIIFCSTKRMCDQLARSIGRSFGAAAIHGDKSQGERDWVLNQFRSGKSPILVATDVAARGLDIKDIRVVINYDFPTGIEDYVHRIGRTGRAGATGVAYTFFSDQDRKYAADLVKLLEGANQQVPPEVRDMAAGGGSGFVKGRPGMSRWDSGGGNMDSGGRGGTRDGFGGRGGMRDGFGGRGGMRDGGGGRGGMRDGGGGFGGGRGGRNDFFGGGRGNRGRGFSSGPVGGRNDRGPDRYNNNMDGRGRYDNRRAISDRSRGRSYSRSYSPSPDRVRTWSRRSRSRSRSRSWTRSRSRSRSRSRNHSRSRSLSRSRSRSRSRDRVKMPLENNLIQEPSVPESEAPSESRMSPMSPGTLGGSIPVIDPSVHLPVAESSGPEAVPTETKVIPAEMEAVLAETEVAEPDLQPVVTDV